MTEQSETNESKKVLRTFSLASFLNDLGADMLQPIWPFFVTGVMGASTQFLGFLDGLGDASVALSQVFSGYLSDRLRRKKVFIWLGYALGVLGRFGYFISTGPNMLIPSKILDRSGKMRDAPRDAYLASVVGHERRGRSFGILRMFDNLGSLCGVLLSIFLVYFLPIKAIILLATIPSALAVLLVISFIRKEHDHVRIFHGLTFADLNKNLTLFLIATGIFTLSTFSFSFLLLASTKSGFTVLSAPVLFLLFTAVTAATALPFGKLSDRIGRKKVIVLSYMFWALVSFGFIKFHSQPVIVLLFALYGLYLGSYEPVFKTFVSELAPPDLRASVLGVFQLVIGLLAFPASAIAGWLWQTRGFQAPFIFSLVLILVSINILSFVKENKNSD